MTINDAERRRFVRIDFDAPTTLIQGNKRWQTALHDVSLHGLMLETPPGFNGDINQPFQVHIDLNSVTQVSMEALLTSMRQPYLGFVCQHIDLDSISHLRRLVELNVGDDSLLERELSALGQSR